MATVQEVDSRGVFDSTERVSANGSSYDWPVLLTTKRRDGPQRAKETFFRLICMMGFERD